MSTGNGRDPQTGRFVKGNHESHGGPPGHLKAVRHGLFWLRKVLKGGRIRKLKGVTRAIERIKAELTLDLGGDCSTQQKILLDDIAKSLVLLYCIDAWLFDLSNLFDTKGVQKWMEERRRLAEHVAKSLKIIGIKRMPAPGQSLNEIIEEMAVNGIENDNPMPIPSRDKKGSNPGVNG